MRGLDGASEQAICTLPLRAAANRLEGWSVSHLEVKVRVK
jgi:hypothetical protein